MNVEKMENYLKFTFYFFEFQLIFKIKKYYSNHYLIEVRIKNSSISWENFIS